MPRQKPGAAHLPRSARAARLLRGARAANPAPTLHSAASPAPAAVPVLLAPAGEAGSADVPRPSAGDSFYCLPNAPWYIVHVAVPSALEPPSLLSARGTQLQQVARGALAGTVPRRRLQHVFDSLRTSLEGTALHIIRTIFPARIIILCDVISSHPVFHIADLRAGLCEIVPNAVARNRLRTAAVRLLSLAPGELAAVVATAGESAPAGAPGSDAAAKDTAAPEATTAGESASAGTPGPVVTAADPDRTDGAGVRADVRAVLQVLATHMCGAGLAHASPGQRGTVLTRLLATLTPALPGAPAAHARSTPETSAALVIPGGMSAAPSDAPGTTPASPSGTPEPASSRTLAQPPRTPIAASTPALEVPLPSVPSHPVVGALYEYTKHEAVQMQRLIAIVKLWIQLNIPRISDGHNFGVGVQQETLGELNRAENHACSILDQGTAYYSARAQLIAKFLGNPRSIDARRTIHEIDLKMYHTLHLSLQDIRNHYAILYDMISKNLEKIRTPRELDAGGPSFL